MECILLVLFGFLASELWQVGVPYTLPPEICVEVISTGNTELLMTEKRKLYFKASAEEFWFCSKEGK